MQIWVRNWSAWAPGLESSADWQDWARGGKQPIQSADFPPLVHLSALFKRRLSQLTRMVLQVGHELSVNQSDLRVVFASHYGEINQQYKISRGLIDEGEVAPAAFSLSVFNTPVALLSIAEKNHGYSSALYGGSQSFGTALLESLALLCNEPQQPVLLITADELLPSDYETLEPGRNQPHAFGLLLSLSGPGVPLEVSWEPGSVIGPPDDSLSPGGCSFLSWFLGNILPEFNLAGNGINWKFRRVDFA